MSAECIECGADRLPDGECPECPLRKRIAELEQKVRQWEDGALMAPKQFNRFAELEAKNEQLQGRIISLTALYELHRDKSRDLDSKVATLEARLAGSVELSSMGNILKVRESSEGWRPGDPPLEEGMIQIQILTEGNYGVMDALAAVALDALLAKLKESDNTTSVSGV